MRSFKTFSGRFDGVIGGPPCQVFSPCSAFVGTSSINMIPDFQRIITEAEPMWWVMENVPAAADPTLIGTKKITFDSHHVGASQYRVRSFWSNLVLDIDFCGKTERHKDPWPTVLASEGRYGGDVKTSNKASRKVGRRMTMEEVNVAMGLPADWSTPALTVEMQYKVRGNGVPLQMGRAVAKAVRKALGYEDNCAGPS